MVSTQSTWALYNEERRLGDQRGSDTLVVPLITSNDGISIAYTICTPQPTKELARDIIFIMIFFFVILVTRYIFYDSVV